MCVCVCVCVCVAGEGGDRTHEPLYTRRVVLIFPYNKEKNCLAYLSFYVLSCQPRVTVTSCFVYNDKLNINLYTTLELMRIDRSLVY